MEKRKLRDITLRDWSFYLYSSSTVIWVFVWVSYIAIAFGFGNVFYDWLYIVSLSVAAFLYTIGGILFIIHGIKYKIINKINRY